MPRKRQRSGGENEAEKEKDNKEEAEKMEKKEESMKQVERKKEKGSDNCDDRSAVPERLNRGQAGATSITLDAL